MAGWLRRLWDSLRGHSRRRSVRPTETQFPGTESADPIDIVIGLDFGTSSSKVIVRSMRVADDRCVAVPFDALGHDSSTYLLPTLLHEDATGRFLLGTGQRQHRDLKLTLMSDPTSIEARLLAVAFAALVIQHARQWFLQTQSEAYGSFRLRWSMNLGVPSAGYDDEEIRRAFRFVAQAAWDLSVRHDQITREGLDEVLEPHATEPEVQADTDVVPEVAASVVGYARSPMRDSGLHLMVDIGASTLDLCSFVLHQREDEDQYALLTALVERLGVHILHRCRLEAAGSDAPQEICQLNVDDPLAVIPDAAEAYVEGDNLQRVGTVRQADEQHHKACIRAVMLTLMDLKIRRDPYSPRWKHGLPVFLGGGGRDMRLFTAVLDDADARLRKNTYADGLVLKRLPKPMNLATDDLPDSLYHRLAVAYGLSFDSMDIGGIEPPSQISDLPPRAPPDDGDPISKDQV